MATARLITSAAIRSACAHRSFTAWGSINELTHARYCTDCGEQKQGAHAILETNCTRDRHYTVCNVSYPTWEKAWGHDMIHEYVGNYDDVHCQAYACQRRDDDCLRICDFVVYTQDCGSPTYWDPAENGQHLRYQLCDHCYIMFFYEHIDCDMDDAYSCYYCERSNAWDPDR